MGNIQPSDIQIGKHLQINPNVRLPGGYKKYWVPGSHNWRILIICCPAPVGSHYSTNAHYCGTIVDVNNNGVELSYNDNKFFVSHQHIDEYWIPYHIADCNNQPLNLGDTVFFADGEGYLIRGQINEIGKVWDSNSIPVHVNNLVYPLGYRKKQYKSRKIIHMSKIVKV